MARQIVFYTSHKMKVFLRPFLMINKLGLSCAKLRANLYFFGCDEILIYFNWLTYFEFANLAYELNFGALLLLLWKVWFHLFCSVWNTWFGRFGLIDLACFPLIEILFIFQFVFLIQVIFIFKIVFLFKVVFQFEVLIIFNVIFIFEVISIYGQKWWGCILARKFVTFCYHL